MVGGLSFHSQEVSEVHFARKSPPVSHPFTRKILLYSNNLTLSWGGG